MIERVVTAAGISLVVTLIAWIIFAIAALLDRVIPFWMPLIFCSALFMVLFLIDLATSTPPERPEE